MFPLKNFEKTLNIEAKLGVLRQKVRQTLWQYIDVFVWSADEMLSVNLKVLTHKLSSLKEA